MSWIANQTPTKKVMLCETGKWLNDFMGGFKPK
jgi:hypothetical protein